MKANFISVVKNVFAFAAVIALSACMSSGGASPATLAMGAHAPAPRGVVALCAAHPANCGMERAENWSAAERRSYAALRAYSDLTRARVEARGGVRTAPRAAHRPVVTWTPQTWETLIRINDEMNAAITPVEDVQRNGVSDYWEFPTFDANGRASGDCEEYALAKQARLVAMGWSPEVLRLATAETPRAGMHAVLVVQTDRGDFVLDNLTRDPTPVNRTGYRWLSVQASERIDDWRFATVMTSSGLSRRGFRVRNLLRGPLPAVYASNDEVGRSSVRNEW